MDERVARLRTSIEAKKFAENAARKGRADLQLEALQRARELQAIEEGFDTPATRAIGQALFAYEEQQAQLTGRPHYRANYTRRMLKEYGAIGTAERMVLKPTASRGFEVLDDAGLQSMSFESIVDRHPNEFHENAVEAARARLQGLPLPARLRGRSSEQRASADPNAAPRFDAEALSFLEGFSDPNAWFLNLWLPRYGQTTAFVADALSHGRVEDVFEILWKCADNSVSNAGQGILKFEIVDTLRADLLEVTRDISQDGTPASFERIVKRFEAWKASGQIPKVPRLLIARAFAAIHPDFYHSTVDAESQDLAIDWFVDHTGFDAPRSRNWAVRALALADHLGRSERFADRLSRNMFPWFVVSQLRARVSPRSIPPGHTPRPASAYAHIPAGRREILLRHNMLQSILFEHLASEFGSDCVWTEHPTGTGGSADALVQLPDGSCYLYEIKIAESCAQVTRQAMGQLLEYSFRIGGLEPQKLFIVGEPALDEMTAQFLERLRSQFNLDISYLQVVVTADLAGLGT